MKIIRSFKPSVALTGGNTVAPIINESTATFFFYVMLTVNLSVTLVNDQLDAKFFYFIIRSLQSSTCFEQSRAHHQEVKLY